MSTPKRPPMAGSTSPPQQFIVDNSVWARLATTPQIRVALTAIVNAYSPSAIMTCPPVAAEVGFSARSGQDHTRVMSHLAAFPECANSPTSSDVLAIQSRLWHGGLLRSVGAIDTLIAAYALRNDAVVLHYDGDFEHVATVTPGFRHQWVIPRGSA